MPSKIAKLPLIGKVFHREIEPFPADVQDFWSFMLARHGMTLVNKNDSKMMQIVGESLDLMGIQDKDDFMKKYTTSVLGRVFTPFELGVPMEGWSLWNQIRVCPHEIRHDVQRKNNGCLGFEWDYTTNSASRASHECDALSVDMLLEWRYQDRMLSPHELAVGLKGYACTDEDVEVSEKQLQMIAKMIRRGAILPDPAKEACDWLNERFGVKQ
jgi:hypothetical protein